MIKSFAFKTILIFTAASAFAKDTGAGLQFKYSLEQLQQVSSYLSLRTKSTEPVLPCDPDAFEARQWLGSRLRGLFSEKVADEVQLYVKDPKKYMRHARHCAAACTCDGYAEVVAKADADLADDPIHKKFSAQLGRNAKKQDAAVCAKNLTWFCASDLKKYLAGDDDK
jgi:hypothetical protein